MKFSTTAAFVILAASVAAAPIQTAPVASIVDSRLATAAQRFSSLLQSVGIDTSVLQTKADPIFNYIFDEEALKANLEEAGVGPEWETDMEAEAEPNVSDGDNVLVTLEISEEPSTYTVVGDHLYRLPSVLTTLSKNIKKQIYNKPVHFAFIAMADRRVYAAVMLFVAAVNLTTMVLALAHLSRRQRQCDCDCDCEKVVPKIVVSSVIDEKRIAL